MGMGTRAFLIYSLAFLYETPNNGIGFPELYYAIALGLVVIIGPKLYQVVSDSRSRPPAR